jgi:hypothetical protein
MNPYETELREALVSQARLMVETSRLYVAAGDPFTAAECQMKAIKLLDEARDLYPERKAS